MSTYDFVIADAHVIDPANGIDRITKVAVADGKIAAVGDEIDLAEAAKVISAQGSYVSPGWFDIHVHTYSHLAFSDPDTVGVYHGVTSMVDAGGGGIWTYEPMRRYWDGRAKTDIYAYLMFHPAGIYLGRRRGQPNDGWLNDLRAPMDDWKEIIERNSDRIIGVKTAVFSRSGWPLLEIPQAVTKEMDMPLYIHIGDQLGGPRGENITPEAIGSLKEGDVVTHVYNGNYGNLLDDDNDAIIPQAYEAKQRGVWFDVGFGNLNFTFEVFDKLNAAGLTADVISTDLQGENVTGPTFSLAHIMSIFLNHGFSLKEVVERVTSKAAQVYHMEDRIGALSVGRAADITIFNVEDGDFVFRDSNGTKRSGRSMITPKLCVKNGEIIECDFEPGLTQQNWSFMPVDETSAPRIADLDHEQREFARGLAVDFQNVDWNSGRSIQTTFFGRIASTGIDERKAHDTLYDALLESRFCVPPGWLLKGMEKEEVLRRLAAL